MVLSPEISLAGTIVIISCSLEGISRMAGLHFLGTSLYCHFSLPYVLAEYLAFGFNIMTYCSFGY